MYSTDPEDCGCFQAGVAYRNTLLHVSETRCFKNELFIKFGFAREGNARFISKMEKGSHTGGKDSEINCVVASKILLKTPCNEGRKRERVLPKSLVKKKKKSAMV